MTNNKIIKNLDTNNITNSKINNLKILNTNNITNNKIIKNLDTNNISNMNNKQLKFNTGKYKEKTYLEIINNTEDLTNIINSNSPGYNKFKIWYNNNLDQEEKKEPVKRNRKIILLQ